MPASSEGQKSAGTARRLEAQLVKVKLLHIACGFIDEYKREKDKLEKLIEAVSKTINATPCDADTLIEKIKSAGAIIADTKDLNQFKRGVELLFDRLETERREDGA